MRLSTYASASTSACRSIDHTAESGKRLGLAHWTVEGGKVQKVKNRWWRSVGKVVVVADGACFVLSFFNAVGLSTCFKSSSWRG